MAVQSGTATFNAVGVLSTSGTATAPTGTGAVGPAFDNVQVFRTVDQVGQPTNITAGRTQDGVLAVDWSAPFDALTADYIVTLSLIDNLAATSATTAMTAFTSTTPEDPTGHVEFFVPNEAHYYRVSITLNADAGTSTAILDLVVPMYVPPVPPRPLPTLRLFSYAFPPGRAFAARNFGKSLDEVQNGG